SPDGSSLYAADLDGTVSTWDPVKGEKTAAYPAPVDASVRKLAFAGDAVLAFGLEFDAVHLWDVKNRKALSPIGVPGGFVDDVIFNSSGELFVAAEGGHAAWWNPRTPAKLRDLKLEQIDERVLPDRSYFGVRGEIFERGGLIHRNGNYRGANGM